MRLFLLNLYLDIYHCKEVNGNQSNLIYDVFRKKKHSTQRFQNVTFINLNIYL